ncbi:MULTISPECIES: hypothetical protein [Rhodococcus]|nr:MULTISPECIES: hypothetical protein [Rhodococcus]MCF8784130.1 hypothetical protein [Rhodococcus ruber]UIR36951.1 hypothetical protein LZP97_25795 [Rhodococcus sp. DMF-1]UIR39779.1 hypothetical protein LZP97_27225 [Rhodococcus sp. DMF-1]UIR39797.1 hypothetical protein LZP97_26805 [Rhodococcus sp. DMF-1]WKK11963.1 hypothetical protein QYN14_25375 [Rhodococcus ruber]
MGCGCRKNANVKYELTTPTGEKRIYLSETEARAARTGFGGGTIRLLTE